MYFYRLHHRCHFVLVYLLYFLSSFLTGHSQKYKQYAIFNKLKKVVLGSYMLNLKVWIIEECPSVVSQIGQVCDIKHLVAHQIFNEKIFSFIYILY